MGYTLKHIHMKNNDWKDRLNVVYSTNPDYQYENIGEEEAETLPKNQQKLRISMEKKGRGGKTVTLIKGFIGTEDDLKELGTYSYSVASQDYHILMQRHYHQNILKLMRMVVYGLRRKGLRQVSYSGCHYFLSQNLY